MKKLLIVILLITVLVDYQFSSNITKADTSDNSSVAAIDESQNNLVYRDYGTGIKLSSNSKLIIKQLNLKLNEESAIIYAINLANYNSYKLYEYQPNKDISYTPESDGIYNIIAKISNGDIIDITPKAIIENSFSDDNNNGFTLLQ